MNNCVTNEFDIVLCKNGEMAVCSCKTGGITSSAIYELDSAAGPERTGMYCKKVLITSKHKLTANASERAKEMKITILTGDKLPKAAELLSQMMKC